MSSLDSFDFRAKYEKAMKSGYVAFMAKDMNAFAPRSWEHAEDIASKVRSDKGARNIRHVVRGWKQKEAETGNFPELIFTSNYYGSDKIFVVWKNGETSLIFSGERGGGSSKVAGYDP